MAVPAASADRIIRLIRSASTRRSLWSARRTGVDGGGAALEAGGDPVDLARYAPEQWQCVEQLAPDRVCRRVRHHSVDEQVGGFCGR
jgi:hypothetical protein